jgi:phytoene dehydrogenase-like protein
MLLKVHDKITKEYDTIIAGSGWAGMTAANKLAKEGHRVLLLEAHNKLGGLATWFKRSSGDHVFDVSLHGFPVGMVKTCRRYWSKEISDKIHKLKSVRFLNPQYQLETDFTKEDFTRLLVEHFKQEKETVDAFFDFLGKMNFYDAGNMTNGELFQKFFPDRNDIVRFLLEPITYANGSTLEDPAITYGIVFSNFMSKGVYIFQGGTDTLIGMLRQEMLNNNVDIRMQSKVSKIIIENGAVAGVQVGDEFIRAKSVLSNGNLISTIFDMTGSEHFSPEYVAAAKKVRLNTSSCQVYIGIKKGESIPFVGDLIFCSEDKIFSTDGLLSPEVSSQTYSLYYPEMRPHLEDRYAIVSSSNARYSDWENLTEEEYETRKAFLIERALVGLEKIIPGVREKIDFTQAATPLTVEYYTHHKKGASFGTKFEGLDISMNMHKQIPGLFHSGSVGIIMSGWLGAANYGIIQAHEVNQFLYAKKEESSHVQI